MSNVAPSKYRRWYRTFLRWFVLVCAGFVIAVSLNWFHNSLKGQLSGHGVRAVTAAVICVLLLSFGMSMIGSVVSNHSFWEQITVQAVLLAIVSCPLAFAYDLVESGKPLATFYGGGGAGVVSAYEAILVLAICLISLITQMMLVHYDSLHREVTLIVGGSLAVVGILLPKMLESYEVLQAYCAAAECDAEYRLGIAWYEVALAFSAAIAALFVAGVLTPVWRPRLYRLFDPDSPCEICSPLPTSDLSERASLDLHDCDGATEEQSVPMLHGEGLEGVISSQIAPVRRHGGVNGHIAAAVVAGLVAGACFSVVSPLFGRR